MDFSNFKNKNNIVILTEIKNEFSDEYLAIRKKENRILTDDEVKILPLTTLLNPNAKEWKVRQKTTNRFIKYLQNNTKKLTILDIGCGNGWFSNKMSELEHNVIALDINIQELEQANRVFKNDHLQFVYGVISQTNLPFQNKFDCITLNASIQYFSDFEKLINTLKLFLKPNGEIHILDSPFYDISKIENAKKRTLDYYTKMSFPEMAKYYYHHSKEKIKDFEILYQPKQSILNKILRRNDSPFMWLCYKF